MRRVPILTAAVPILAALASAPAGAGERYRSGEWIDHGHGPVYGEPAELAPPVRPSVAEYRALHLPVGVLYNVPPRPYGFATERTVIRARY